MGAYQPTKIRKTIRGTSVTDWRDVFCGRKAELKQLVEAYESVASGSGPRLVVVCADRGMGKTRLVQELYRHLATTCDPDCYWPDASLFKGNNLRVAPDFSDPETQAHFSSFSTSERSMPFLWWGFRINDPLDRNAVRSDMAGLVNSAGAAQRIPHDALTAEAWHAAMEAKFFTYIHMMDLVIKRMAMVGRGSIVNVVGVGGKVASPVHLPGGAANAALMLASAGLAAAYGPKGVRVNAVNPGPTFTDRLKGRMDALAQSQGISVEHAIELATRDIPLGRFAQPSEIADAVLFLSSARASYITGAVLGMDGATTPMVV